MRPAVGAVVLALLLAGCGSDAALSSRAHGISMGMMRKVGDRIWWTDYGILKANAPVRLVSARFSDLPAAVQPSGPSLVALGPHPAPRPDKDVSGPITGVVVKPTGTYLDGPDVYLDITAVKPGRYVIRGIDLVYELNGDRRTLHIDDGLVLCVGAKRPPRDCAID